MDVSEISITSFSFLSSVCNRFTIMPLKYRANTEVKSMALMLPSVPVVNILIV